MRLDEQRVDGEGPLQQADVLLRVAVDDEQALERVVEALAVGRAELGREVVRRPEEPHSALLRAPFYHVCWQRLDVGLLLL